MARWQPDAAERLRVAARELFVERGYDETTVADIAERAGLTSRTFFRHFPDKREVLFAGSDRLERSMHDAAADAHGSTWDAVGAALQALAGFIGEDREWSQRRQAWLDGDPDLHGRELTKLASLARVLAEALRERGLADVDARLAADAGMVAFRSAFATWLETEPQQELSQVMAQTLDRLRRL